MNGCVCSVYEGLFSELEICSSSLNQSKALKSSGDRKAKQAVNIVENNFSNDKYYALLVQGKSSIRNVIVKLICCESLKEIS